MMLADQELVEVNYYSVRPLDDQQAADKELFIVPGATHIRTYFVKEYVEQITAKIQRFFTDKLK